MPEAFAVLLVFVVSVSAYVAARLHSSNPANASPAADFQRLRQHRAWLEERLRLAWREKWDQIMISRLVDQIEAVDADLARQTAPQRAVDQRDAG
jgi:ABC-type uncharacterized transport system fused permease/ATPase subunit